MKTLNDAIIKSMFGKSATFFVQFVFLAFYSRIFSPQEFGIIASIQVYIVFFQMLSSIGIGPAIINEETFEKHKRDGVFTITFLLGLILALIFFKFSYFLNEFYGNYEYQSIAIFISLSIFFSSLNILPVTALTKDLKFIRLGVIDVLSELLAFITVIFMYYYNFGIIALASRPFIQSISKFILCWFSSYNTSLGQPAFGREIQHIKCLLKFSTYQFLFNFINYFSRNLDNILVGKYFGMSSLGIYNKSYQLMRYPIFLTSSALSPAIQPVLTKIRNDIDNVVLQHNRLCYKMLSFSIPVSVFMYLNSDNIVYVLFGSQWSDVSKLIEVFAIIIPVQILLTTTGSFFQVMNKPNLLFYSGCFSSFFNILAIIYGIYLGDIVSLAYCLVFSFCINFFQAYYLLFRYCFRSNYFLFIMSLFKCAYYLIIPTFLYYIFNIYIESYNLNMYLNIIINTFCFISISFLQICYMQKYVK